MNVDAQKLKIIEWVSSLQDSQVIQELLKLKEKKRVLKKKTEMQYDISDSIDFKDDMPNANKKEQEVERKFGDGKYLIEYIAEDFNDPIDHFDEDTKP
jgi:hypothetical protein